jgi:hypothetical protein
MDNGTVQRLRAEFMEMPGLRLTPEQVQRLCGVERAMCRAALKELVDSGLLRVNADGTYGRRTEGLWRVPRATPARAGEPRVSTRTHSSRS